MEHMLEEGMAHGDQAAFADRLLAWLAYHLGKPNHARKSQTEIE